MRSRVAGGLGTLAGGLSRRIGAGGGSVIGGRVQLLVDPHALATLTQGRTVVLVSGTNGKSTTTAFIAAALGRDRRVVTNAEGANMAAGLVAALAHSDPAAAAVLEVDEHWLPSTATRVAPRVVCLLNLSRDQMDRTAEVRVLAGRWRQTAAESGAHVVANADDPLVAWAAAAAADVTWVAAGQRWTDDARSCPQCTGQLEFDRDIGRSAGPAGWRCGSCGLSRPAPDLWLDGDVLVQAGGARLPLELNVPGRFNLANAAMAVGVAVALGVVAADAAAAAATITEVGGRYRVATVGGARARLLLAKNPAGWLEVLDLLAGDDLPVVVGINARAADGRDPSWLWDVPFERLRGRTVVATGERSRDLAVRLAYAEVPHRHCPDIEAAIRSVPGPEMYVVANYTAFQAVRGIL